MKTKLFCGVFLVVKVINICHCISIDQLFPYGLQFGDSPLLPGKILLLREAPEALKKTAYFKTLY